jgi:hypothetical protein
MAIPIYIPTYISDQNYNPSRVLPRLLFYNGMLDCESYYIESGSAYGGIAFEQNAFPYFDNYNVVSGSFPTTDSKSLLFLNETAVYGAIPTETLYSEYWTKYVELLYNPRTRLLNASTIIPLADYFKMELNDIVELRGNYYHLRAINDYNLKNGECNIQLLGPILDDALVFTTTTTTTAPTTTSTSTTSTSTTSTSTTTSTTTTTTISPNPCSCMEIIVTSAPAETSWLSCYGQTTNTFYSVNGTYYQCVQKIGGLNQIDFISGAGTIGQVGNCKTQDCPPATTTTTTAPTTTTTTTTTSTTTTTAAPTYNYYNVTRFDCPSCTNPTYSLVARNNTIEGTLATSHYYNNGDGYVYRIDGYNAGSYYDVDLDLAASAGTNCSLTCAI